MEALKVRKAEIFSRELVKKSDFSFMEIHGLIYQEAFVLLQAKNFTFGLVHVSSSLQIATLNCTLLYTARAINKLTTFTVKKRMLLSQVFVSFDNCYCLRQQHNTYLYVR